MRWFAAVLGIAIILLVLWEAFETIVLPRRVTRNVRLTRLYYRYTWSLWARLAQLARSPKLRESLFGIFGPASLIGLLGVWAVTLVFGFGLLHLAAESGQRMESIYRGFWTDVYLSGTTFFTLGIGDVTPHTRVGRLLTVLEAGIGFGFLAVVIGYLPTIYQSFSRRETNITLLDARAGSPPSAGELLRRYAADGVLTDLDAWLRDWEGWAADQLESHLSYPVLCYFRSQHDNQSWLAALACILDTCALVMTGVDGVSKRQAKLTFAIARHTVVDLAQIFRTKPSSAGRDRLPAEQLAQLRSFLETVNVRFASGEKCEERLAGLRAMYEPYVWALADHLRLRLPNWMPTAQQADNWQTSAWGRIEGITTPDGMTSSRARH